MFKSRAYKPPPEGWRIRALTHFDCSDFSLYTLPIVGWVVEGQVDVEWLSSKFKAAIEVRAPWLRGRLARTESGWPRYEVHVPPPDLEIEFVSVTQTTITTTIRDLLPYQPYGSNQPAALLPTSHFDPGILSPKAKVTDGVDGYIKRNEPLLNMHFTHGPDVTLISFSWAHCLFDGVGWGHIVDAWKRQLNGETEDPELYDTMSEKPEKFFDFTEHVTIDPDWAPTGWIPTSASMWTQAAYKYLKGRYYYQPLVYSTIIIPKWLVDRWKIEAKEELPNDKYVSSNDLVFAWCAKHMTSPFPATEHITLMSTICLRLRCPELPAHLVNNSSTSYVLPDNFSVLDLQMLSIPQIALAFRNATAEYKNPDNVLREVTYEYRRLRDNNGARTMIPLMNPRQKFFILDSVAGLKYEQIDFTKREGGTRGNEIKTVTTFVWYGEGMQMLSNDSMGGFQFCGMVPKVCFESMKRGLEKEVEAPRARL